MKKQIKFFGGVFMLCTVLFIFMTPVSCKVTEEGVKLFQGDLETPVITSFSVESSDSIKICFSESVEMKNVVIEKIEDDVQAGGEIENEVETANERESANGKIAAIANFSDDQKTATVVSAEEFSVGKKYALYGEIEDASGNTLTFKIPFLGFNSRVPKIYIMAVHPKYSSSKRAGQTVYKNEFVELYAATGGNISGLQIFSAVDGEAKSFTLPSMEVKAGTFITVHMRSRGDGCVSETSENLRLCKQEYASDTSLDLWAENTESCLGDTADVIMLLNKADGKIIDAVAYAPSGNEIWATDILRDAAEKAMSAGVWNGSSPKNAVSSDDLTASKMIVRADGKNLANGDVAINEKKNWTIAQVISGSGKNRTSNLGKFFN